MAPRTFRLNIGQLGSGSPIDETRTGLAKISAAYRAAGAADQFAFFITDGVGRVLSPTMCPKDTEFLRPALDVVGLIAKSMRPSVGEHAHVRS